MKKETASVPHRKGPGQSVRSTVPGPAEGRDGNAGGTTTRGKEKRGGGGGGIERHKSGPRRFPLQLKTLLSKRRQEKLITGKERPRRSLGKGGKGSASGAGK